jgi:trk system potassium uptake protein TrkA
MKIIVVGNGKIGKSIVGQLAEEGHEVVVIDNDEGRVSELGDLRDVMALHGNGALRQVQLEAGVGDADMLIAVTGGDELNLLS